MLMSYFASCVLGTLQEQLRAERQVKNSKVEWLPTLGVLAGIYMGSFTFLCALILALDI